MTRADEVLAWADEGTAEVLSQARADCEPPLNLHEAMCAIRCAYSQGYVDCLTEPKPSSIGEAMTRVTILELLAGFK